MPLKYLSTRQSAVWTISLKHGTGFNGFWEVSTTSLASTLPLNDKNCSEIFSCSLQIFSTILILFPVSVNTFLTSRQLPVAGRTQFVTICLWTNVLRRLRNPRPTEPTRGRAACGPWTRRRSQRWTRRWRSGQGKIHRPSRRPWCIQVKTTFVNLKSTSLTIWISRNLGSSWERRHGQGL